MTVYGYARVSTGRQASEGESLDVQRRQHVPQRLCGRQMEDRYINQKWVGVKKNVLEEDQFV